MTSDLLSNLLLHLSNAEQLKHLELTSNMQMVKLTEQQVLTVR